MTYPVIIPKKIALGFWRLALNMTRPSWVLSPSSAAEVDSKDIAKASVTKSIVGSPEL
jgi:hypothetical protein